MTAEPDALAREVVQQAIYDLAAQAQTPMPLYRDQLERRLADAFRTFGLARYREGAEQMRDTAKLACKVKADEASRAGLTDIAKIYRDCQHMVSAFPLTPEGQ